MVDNSLWDQMGSISVGKYIIHNRPMGIRTMRYNWHIKPTFLKGALFDQIFFGASFSTNMKLTKTSANMESQDSTSWGPWLFAVDIGDYISYPIILGIIRNHCKDPY